MSEGAENMSNVRKNLTIFISLIALLIPVLGCADTDKSNSKDLSSEKSNIGLWNPEDCAKISEASGLFLHLSGELLKESDEKRKEGDEKNADKLAQGALYLSELAANYAKNFEAYCKR